MQSTQGRCKETEASSSVGRLRNEFSPAHEFPTFSLVANIQPPCSRVPESVNHMACTFDQAENDRAVHSAASETMMRRWMKMHIENLPGVDQAAVNRGRSSLQHAPEYSQ